MVTIEEKNKIKKAMDSMPLKIVLSNLCDKTYIYKKTVISKIIMKDKMMYQVERFTDKQAFHENIGIGELEDTVFELFSEKYRQMNVFCEDVSYDFKVSKKGKLLSKKTLLNNCDTNNKKEHETGNLSKTSSHNRKKNYILQEGTVIPPLVDLGIFTKEGKVVRSMYDKFKQINRFIELVDDVIKKYDNGDKVFNIIDFGCGKSYLTFILYYYLVEIKGMKVNITGLDLKEDVIRKCICNRHGHQYCIPNEAVEKATSVLINAQIIDKNSSVGLLVNNNMLNNKFADFEHLYDTILMLIGSIKGIGPLTVYDTAKRIGHLLNPPIYPEMYVYLSSGALEGAKGLLGRNDLKFREPICIFAPYFGSLPSIFIEDILCVYKDSFKAAPPYNLSKKMCLRSVKIEMVDRI